MKEPGQNRFGLGHAYYLASDAEDRFLDDFYSSLLLEHGIEPLLNAPANVEVTVRQNEQHRLLFVLNHNATPASVPLPESTLFHEHLTSNRVSGSLELPAYGVAILERT